MHDSAGLRRARLRPAARPRQAASIAEFWRWWSRTRNEAAAAIQSGGAAGLADAFSERVHAIHPGLEWELMPGRAAAHALVVTAAGKPELRAVAHRWLAQAPQPDAVWEYHCVRIADPAVFTSTLQVGVVKLELAKLGYAIAVDRQRSQIDVSCYHPAFAELPEEAQAQVTFLSLDWLLGEDNVEIWLGEICWTPSEPPNLRRPNDLKHAVHAIAEDDRWALMTAEDRDGLPLIATVSMPLRPARWPRFDLHVAVVLGYQRFNDGLLPVDESLQALRRFEDYLAGVVGGNGALVAHETHNGQRALHFYVDAQSDARSRIEAAARAWTESRAIVDAALDPAFERLSHLMGH
ncbi:DUF695 domain-containing protein [Allorhizocola rhizosphaerae]|uniref:DUF695 domain-containing protein n=1 Tax=Allorhizocola rhizosphaerae TaxID=1872709 RepID=UPI000E3EBB6F|nr:DUF695 domain-containing protein [Allorhizocola rhizosphaerae]